jgi:hypothetical protein
MRPSIWCCRSWKSCPNAAGPATSAAAARAAAKKLMRRGLGTWGVSLGARTSLRAQRASSVAKPCLLHEKRLRRHFAGAPGRWVQLVGGSREVSSPARARGRLFWGPWRHGAHFSEAFAPRSPARSLALRSCSCSWATTRDRCSSRATPTRQRWWPVSASWPSRLSGSCSSDRERAVRRPWCPASCRRSFGCAAIGRRMGAPGPRRRRCSASATESPSPSRDAGDPRI